jgi:hypothetical protein
LAEHHGLQRAGDEYVAWRDYFLASYQGRPAAETVSAMTLAITTEPYFLLHK